MNVEPQDSDRNLVSRSLERSKTSQRMKYQAESALIRSKYGDLEAIRIRLGLSRRKICQLLLVDPSAWTRWNQPGSEAPPHIYRALEWYLLLAEKEPRALLPMGTWSSTAFEDRLVGLEAGLQQLTKARVGLMGALLMLGAVGGALLILVLH